MRSFIAFLLLFAILLPTLSPWGTVAYFNINRKYIARVLCENRDRPQLNCNGKCYLAKKLKQQQEKKDKETTEQVSNIPVAHLFCISASSFLFLSHGFIQKAKSVYGYLVCIYSSPVYGILRPPQ